MKKNAKLKNIPAIILLSLLLALVPAMGASVTVAADSSTTAPADEFRAVWVSSVVNLDYPSARNLTVDQLKNEAIRILDRAKAAGMNAVILQVRPTSDALYKSSIFPWSYYLTGKQGSAPASGFDPLAFWVDEAHKRSMKIHAWVNPFRITMGSASAPETDVTKLAANNPARLHPEWTVAHTDGRLYYNPGLAEARQLIIDGMCEIVKNYDVDGVHFDDYFYPGTDFNDAAAFKADPRGFTALADWRRDNINKLIKETGEAVHAIKPDVDFGVSPAGIWANKSSSPYGSDTNGNQTYYSGYADSKAWVQLKYVDYIAPQIYWHIGYSIADYTTLVKWWNNVVEGTGVKLYIGQAAYRVDPASSTVSWRSPAELVNQMKVNRETKNYAGSIYFRALSVIDNKATFEALQNYYNPPADTGLPNVPNIKSLAVNKPMNDATINASSYFMMGTSDPTQPLTINGQLISNRSSSGFFGYLVSLNAGKNVITLKQGNTVVTRVITRGTPPSTYVAPSVSSAMIVPNSEYPLNNDKVYRAPGQTITLKCNAPIGSTVTASFMGRIYTLKPATTTRPGTDKLYTTTFSYTVALSSYKGAKAGSVYDLGMPVYTMTYGDIKSSVTAGTPYVIVGGAPVNTEVKTEFAKVYYGATTSGGPAGELAKGMTCTAAYAGDGWLKLTSGYYIFVDDVNVTPVQNPPKFTLSTASYSLSDRYETLSFPVDGAPSDMASLDATNRILTYRVYSVAGVSPIVLPQESIFSSVAASYNASNATATYQFKMKNLVWVDGFYSELSGGKLTFHIKIRPKVGNNTLNGITVMIDPGHGGSASGAIGPLGTLYCEKDAALDISKKLKAKLEAMGAKVVMTRETDVYLDLYTGRLDISRKLKPDLFLSIHLNSMGDDYDGNTVLGAAAFYRPVQGMLFAQQLYSNYTKDLNLGLKGCRAENYAVINGFWAPHVLLETGFINNPYESEFLFSAKGQDAVSGSIANSILKYFN